MIHPARKAGVPWENYCPKGKVDVEMAAGDQKYVFQCFPDPEDCGSSACIGDFLSLLTENVTEIDLSLCVAETEVNTAAIWEINISEVSSNINIYCFRKLGNNSRQMIQVRFKAFLWRKQKRDST